MARGVRSTTPCKLATFNRESEFSLYLDQVLYPPSKPLPESECSNAHQPAYLDSLRPPKPFDLPCAAIAARSSKKSKMILVRASEATLIGMNVLKASRAELESSSQVSVLVTFGFRTRLLTLLANLEQLVSFPRHHTANETAPAPLQDAREDLSGAVSRAAPIVISTSPLALTGGSAIRSSCAKLSPCKTVPRSKLKKFLMKVRAALGSEAGRKGRSRKGMSRPTRPITISKLREQAWDSASHLAT